MYFGLVITVAGLFTILLAAASRDVMFYALDSDTEKQTRAAAGINEWKWPSDMHRFAGGKAYMKDAGILGVALMQRLRRDRQGAFPIHLLCYLSNATAAIFLYLIASHYWDAKIGAALAVLFMTSFWPHQVALMGGFQTLAHALLLVAVYCFQAAENGSFFIQGSAYLAGGVAMGFLIFASASSRKYFPLAAGAFFWSQRSNLIPMRQAVAAFEQTLVLEKLILVGSMAALFILLGVIYFGFDSFVTALYEGRGPKCLRPIVSGQRSRELSFYLDKKRSVMKAMGWGGLGLWSLLAVSLVFTKSAVNYWAQALVALGMIAVIGALIFPNVIENVKSFIGYWDSYSMNPHFQFYIDFFAKKNIRITGQTRGAGWRWLPVFFWRMTPVPFLLTIVLTGIWMILAASGFLRQDSPGEIVLLVALGLSPVLFGELTGSPQLARPYFPALTGLFMLIGFSLFRLSPVAGDTLWLLLSGVIAVSAMWNCRIFLKDVWPARMAARELHRVLGRMGIKKFYTYDTPFNDALVFVWPAYIRKKYDIQFIKSAHEPEDGYIVLPGMSAKALNMESQRVAYEGGDFKNDPIIGALVARRLIDRCSVATFQTFGSSRIWAQESEVMTYRDLILKEVTDHDRWLGLARILDVSKLRAVLELDRSQEKMKESIVASSHLGMAIEHGARA
ncbi:MAG: hypothetical protein HY547_08550 [Elusimicrobia bacterium]|nr:hypothetical protein [Elusimicrobiota bacterium]